VYVKPTAPRSIGGVLDDSIRLYREGFTRAWILALCAQLLVAIPMFFVRLKIVGSSAVNPQALLAMYRSPAFWLPYIVGAIASIGFYNAIILQLSERFQGEVLPAGQSLARGFRLLPRVILLFLVFALGGAAIGVFFLFAFKASIAARLILSILAFALVLYVLGRIYLANIALLVEDFGVFKSLETTWALTRGHWWRGATIYSVIVLIAVVFYFVIAFVTGLLAVALNPATSAAGSAVTELVSVLGTSLVVPLIPATLLCIYHDFKLRTEGADLATRVSALAPR